MKINAAKHIIKQFICWVLLLQMINVSIDPPDFRQFKNAHVEHKEDLSLNEIESIYELVSEGLFGKDVPESDDADIDTKPETPDLYCFMSRYSEATPVRFSAKRFSHYLHSFSPVHIELSSPPPKQV